MGNLQASGPNAEQITYWNETAGPKWVTLHDIIDAQIVDLGQLAMDRARIRISERVLDVGCGCGATSIDLGRRVGAHGSVVGIDISGVMLARAREAAAAAGVSWVRFEHADAQTHPFPPHSYDLAYSRFGVMFFADPVAAFANLRRGLRPGGRLAFICWRTLPENPWLLIPLMAAAAHVQLPPPPAPDAPGPFALGDGVRLQSILTGAGFEDVVLEDVNTDVTVGGQQSLERAVEFLMQMGPAAAVLRDVEPAVRTRVAAAVRDAVAPYQTAQGLRMAAGARIVTARNPD